MGVVSELEADFEAYVRDHGRRLESLAYLLTGDAGRAEDLVQQTLLTAYRRWSRLSGMSGRDAYVRRILVSRYLDWRRRRSSRERPTADVGLDVAGGRDPAEVTAEADLVRRALAGLTRQQRAVLVLRHWGGYDDGQIAATLRCGEATVRSHASRGLARLRAALDETGQPLPSRTRTRTRTRGDTA